MSVINEQNGLFRFEIFNFIKFKEFLEKNKAFATAASIVIATQITLLSSSFTDNIIVPFFERDVNGDGKKDIVHFENININLFGIKIKIGKFIIDIIKFLIVVYVVFVISLFYDKYDLIVKYK